MPKLDFQDGKGRVSAHQHPNGGGWVADTASVDETAFVGPDAEVYGHAGVYGHARVFGNASVFGDAVIKTSRFPQIKRSDGWDFIAAPCSDGITRVIAGCRYFTFEEAETHWEETRGGTLLGDETMLILKYLQSYVELMKEEQ